MVAVPLALVVTYAYCSIAVDDAGSIEALSAGVQLVRERVGTSLLAWLVNLAVMLGAGIAAAIAIILAAIPLVIVGIIVGVSLGSGAVVAYAVVAGAVYLATLLAGVAALATYSWIYWMQIYLRLTKRLGPDGDTPGLIPAGL